MRLAPLASLLPTVLEVDEVVEVDVEVDVEDEDVPINSRIRSRFRLRSDSPASSPVRRVKNSYKSS